MPLYRRLFALGYLAAILTALWFALALFFPDRLVWTNALLLIPFFVLTGMLAPAAALLRALEKAGRTRGNKEDEDEDDVLDTFIRRGNGAFRVVLWVLIVLAFLGLAPLIYYALLLAGAATDAGSPIWRSEAVSSAVVATVLGCTAVLETAIGACCLHLFCIVNWRL